MSATCARGGAGIVVTLAGMPGGEPWAARLAGMQADMDRIAAGKLPIPPNGRNATASDVEEYLRGQRLSVRA